jgi:hypothetical protein
VAPIAVSAAFSNDVDHEWISLPRLRARRAPLSPPQRTGADKQRGRVASATVHVYEDVEEQRSSAGVLDFLDDSSFQLLFWLAEFWRMLDTKARIEKSDGDSKLAGLRSDSSSGDGGICDGRWYHMLV